MIEALIIILQNGLILIILIIIIHIKKPLKMNFQKLSEYTQNLENANLMIESQINNALATQTRVNLLIKELKKFCSASNSMSKNFKEMGV